MLKTYFRYGADHGWLVWDANGDGEELGPFDTVMEALIEGAEHFGLDLGTEAMADLTGEELGWALEPFHDGLHIYAVVSYLIAGHEPRRESIIRAHAALFEYEKWASENDLPAAFQVRPLIAELVRRYGFEQEGK